MELKSVNLKGEAQAAVAGSDALFGRELSLIHI